MRPVTAIALFCEDIRAEVLGTDSLVGVLPDNLAIGPTPGFLPKLAIYLRLQIYDETQVQTIKGKVILPGGQEIELATFENIQDTKKKALENGMPYAGLVGKAVMSPVPIEQYGRIEVV